MLPLSLLTCPVRVVSEALMLSFCWLNCEEIELKRLLRVCAWVSNSCRAEVSLGLADAVCTAEKKLLSTALMPVLPSDSNLSMLVIWLLYAVASALSAVLVCNWVSM